VRSGSYIYTQWVKPAISYSFLNISVVFLVYAGLLGYGDKPDLARHFMDAALTSAILHLLVNPVRKTP
jgi:hypothetical protein